MTVQVVDTGQINANSVLDASGSGLNINVNTAALNVLSIFNGAAANVLNVGSQVLSNQNTLHIIMSSPPNTMVQLSWAANGSSVSQSNIFRILYHVTNDVYITQDNPTGNMIFRTASGTARMNINNDGTISACSSPATNAVTRMFTGVEARCTNIENVSSSTSLANSTQLVCTAVEAGNYDIEVMAYFSTASNTNIGYKCAIDGGVGGGLAGTLSMGLLIQNPGGLQSGGSTVYSAQATSTTVAAPGASWTMFKAFATNVGAGNILQFRFAQNTACTANLQLLTGSYMKMTKVA